MPPHHGRWAEAITSNTEPGWGHLGGMGPGLSVNVVWTESVPLIQARKVVKGLSLNLSKDERKAVAQRAVDELRWDGRSVEAG